MVPGSESLISTNTALGIGEDYCAHNTSGKQEDILLSQMRNKQQNAANMNIYYGPGTLAGPEGIDLNIDMSATALRDMQVRKWPVAMYVQQP